MDKKPTIPSILVSDANIKNNHLFNDSGSESDVSVDQDVSIIKETGQTQKSDYLSTNVQTKNSNTERHHTTQIDNKIKEQQDLLHLSDASSISATNYLNLSNAQIGMDVSKQDNSEFQQQTPKDRRKNTSNVFVHQLRRQSTIHFQMQHYNPLTIPPDFEKSRKHAKSRQTGKMKKVMCPEFCECCGFQIQRRNMTGFESSQTLNFLGSGFPCYFNFIKYCGILLAIFTFVSGIYTLATNLMGSYCHHSENDRKEQSWDIEKQMKKCHYNWPHILSLANKIDQPQYLEIQQYLNIIVMILVMITLQFLRKSQRQLDIDIDIAQITPSDYTILVNNIPKYLKGIDYEEKLFDIFTNSSVQGYKVNIKKINLVYNIDYICKLEKKLAYEVKLKQTYLTHFGYKYNKEDSDDCILTDLDTEIDHIRERIHNVEDKIPLKPERHFAGKAFISFNTEQDKQLVIENNPYTFWEQIKSYFSKDGTLSNPSENDLLWNNKKLFIQEAPEPNDIDWEFIHIDKKTKINARIKAVIYSILFEICVFTVIWKLSSYREDLEEYIFINRFDGQKQQFNEVLAQLITISISASIVLFNKFVLAIVFHKIVDKEFYSTKTRFNIAYASKLSVALFTNSAIVTYLAEILLNDNYYGPGGFIYAETWIFFWNFLLPPFIWLVDPWTIIKNRKRKRELKKYKRNVCYLTQQEANELIEKPEYTQGKRYADIMKTMWFTFFYGTCIPIGLIFSLVTLLLYYWVDKYNLIKRRTVKECLSKDVSIEMIEHLELVLILFTVGNFTFTYQLFGIIHTPSLIMLVISVLYYLIPMQKINELIFPIERIDETMEYNDATDEFITDYDRLNPITKRHALFLLQKSAFLQRKSLQMDEEVQDYIKKESQQEDILKLQRNRRSSDDGFQ